MKDTVIITGAAKGIGEAAARRFAKTFNVVIADMDPCGEETAEDIRRSGGSALFVRTDISSEADVRNLREQTLKEFGSIRFLVNNAAIQKVTSLEETPCDDFRKVIDVNLCGTFNCLKIMAEVMAEGSSILNCISVHSSVPRKDKYAYDASKAGIEMLTKEAALALAPRKITVNAIAYGAVITPMNADWTDNEKAVNNVKKNIPLKWIAEADEIAEYMETILTVFAKNSTGSTYTIDGGRSLI